MRCIPKIFIRQCYIRRMELRWKCEKSGMGMICVCLPRKARARSKLAVKAATDSENIKENNWRNLPYISTMYEKVRQGGGISVQYISSFYAYNLIALSLSSKWQTLIIIDIRSRKGYEQSHLRNAICPWHQQQNASAESDIEKLKRNMPSIAADKSLLIISGRDAAIDLNHFLEFLAENVKNIFVLKGEFADLFPRYSILLSNRTEQIDGLLEIFPPAREDARDGAVLAITMQHFRRSIMAALEHFAVTAILNFTGKRLEFLQQLQSFEIIDISPDEAETAATTHLIASRKKRTLLLLDDASFQSVRKCCIKYLESIRYSHSEATKYVQHFLPAVAFENRIAEPNFPADNSNIKAAQPENSNISQNSDETTISFKDSLKQLLFKTKTAHPHQYNSTIEMAHRIFWNILSNPKEEKYRKIRMNNPAFISKVDSSKSLIQLILIGGFVLDIEKEAYVLPLATMLQKIREMDDVLIEEMNMIK